MSKEEEEASELNYYHVIFLVIWGSFVLIMLFYFFEYIETIMTVLICFSSVSGIVFILNMIK